MWRFFLNHQQDESRLGAQRTQHALGVTRYHSRQQIRPHILGGLHRYGYVAETDRYRIARLGTEVHITSDDSSATPLACDPNNTAKLTSV